MLIRCLKVKFDYKSRSDSGYHCSWWKVEPNIEKNCRMMVRMPTFQKFQQKFFFLQMSKNRLKKHQIVKTISIFFDELMFTILHHLSLDTKKT